MPDELPTNKAINIEKNNQENIISKSPIKIYAKPKLISGLIFIHL